MIGEADRNRWPVWPRAAEVCVIRRRVRSMIVLRSAVIADGRTTLNSTTDRILPGSADPIRSGTYRAPHCGFHPGRPALGVETGQARKVGVVDLEPDGLSVLGVLVDSPLGR